MTLLAKRALAVCLLTLVVEAVLLLMIAEPVVLLFALGPVVFLAVLVWRRRTHPTRSRRLATIAVGIAAFGIAGLAVACFQHRANPNPERVSIAPLAVPLVQWLAVIYIWIAIAREESREKSEKPPVSS